MILPIEILQNYWESIINVSGHQSCHHIESSQNKSNDWLLNHANFELQWAKGFTLKIITPKKQTRLNSAPFSKIVNQDKQKLNEYG